MHWNWQQPEWPHFRYDPGALTEAEATFLRDAGVVLGVCEHVGETDAHRLKVELISAEAIKTSAIEGEVLNRDSVQSSVRRQLGLQSDNRRVSQQEAGIAEMMVSLYDGFADSLTAAKLHHWHRLLMRGSHRLDAVGAFRRHEEPMKVVSGRLDDPRIHFEAPPSKRVGKEMKTFLRWFNDSRKMPALTRSALAHLHFVSIHPYEDGNGRLARALSVMALAQAVGSPMLLALSPRIAEARSEYYRQLERANRGLEVTEWLEYFGGEILAAQQSTLRQVRFVIEKTKLYDRLRGRLNARQEKVLERLFREGPDGFKGGLSAVNYTAIAKCSRATTTRDLSELVAMAALVKTGQLKGTRYRLAAGEQETPR